MSAREGFAGSEESLRRGIMQGAEVSVSQPAGDLGGVTGRYRGWDVNMGVMTAKTTAGTLYHVPKKSKKKSKKSENSEHDTRDAR